MKKRVISFVLSFIFICGTLFTAYRTNQIMIRKSSRDRMQDFIESEANKDILFIGTSQIMNGVIPMELWHEHGYTSYILCSEYTDMDRNVMMLRLALQYTAPRLVVLNVENYWSKSDEEDAFNGYHEFADYFPLTAEKVKTTVELYDSKEKRMEIIAPFYIYHSRWKELKENDFRKHGQSNIFKGFEYSDEVEEVHLTEAPAREEGILIDEYGIRSMDDLIAECRSRNIPVLLTTLPFEAEDDEQLALQGLYQYADRQQVAYLNFLEMPELVDETTDFKNFSHLNVYGAEKLTAYLGDYIAEHYEIEDHSKDPSYRTSWDADYEDYMKYKAKAQED